MPLKTRLRDSTSGPEVSANSGERKTGCGVAGQGREVDLERPLEQLCVGRNAVALAEQEHIARNEPRCLDELRAPVADNGGLHGQVAGKRLDGALGLPLLRERKQRVEDDHRQDRDPEHGRAGQEGKADCDPQQERQRMGELLDELARPAAPTQPHELVAAVDDEPPLDLPARKALRVRAQVTLAKLGAHARLRPGRRAHRERDKTADAWRQPCCAQARTPSAAAPIAAAVNYLRLPHPVGLRESSGRPSSPNRPLLGALAPLPGRSPQRGSGHVLMAAASAAARIELSNKGGRRERR